MIMLLLYLLAPSTLLFSLGGGIPGSERLPDAQDVKKAEVLHIYLLEGFSGQTVAVQVNGKEVLHKDVAEGAGLLRGYEDSFTVEVPKGAVTVEVNVPTRKLVETVVVEDVSAKPYLLLWIENGQIKHENLENLENRFFG